MNRLFAIIVLASVAISGYTGGGQESATAAEKAEIQTIKAWHHQPMDNPSGILFFKMADEFEAANPNVNIEMESTPHAQYLKALPTAYAAGEMPDVYGMSYRNIYAYYEQGTMSPVDEAAAKTMGYSSIEDMRSDWEPGALEPYQVKGQNFGLPWSLNIYAWVINTDHFREAGLDPDKDYPKIWDDVFAIGPKLTIKEGGRITREAISFPFYKAAAWYMLELEPIMWNHGGTIMNEDETECLVNSRAGVETMALIRRRFEVGISDKDLSNSLTYDEDAFPTGKFSMSIGGNWGPQRWYKTFPEVTHEGLFKSIPYPVLKEGDDPPITTTGWAWVVSSQSEYKETAWKFADFMTKDASRSISETGLVIPRKGWAKTEGAKTIPQSEFWNSMMPYSKALTPFKQYPVISEPLKRMMQEILLNDADIRTTLDAVKVEIDRAIKE
jgi:multiple sugar transport system substrate-binding protein